MFNSARRFVLSTHGSWSTLGSISRRLPNTILPMIRLYMPPITSMGRTLTITPHRRPAGCPIVEGSLFYSYCGSRGRLAAIWWAHMVAIAQTLGRTAVASAISASPHPPPCAAAAEAGKRTKRRGSRARAVSSCAASPPMPARLQVQPPSSPSRKRPIHESY
eukprot:SAG11_NODE_1711_length_4401_cov_4.188052_2_plen_162_part_00